MKIVKQNKDSFCIFDETSKVNLIYEFWMYIIRFEGIYIISNRGRVCRMARTIVMSNGQVRHVKMMHIKLKKMKSGYVIITLHNNSVQYHTSVHILVCRHYVLNLENKPWVNHKDGRRDNNEYLNLEWTTISENHLHAYRDLNRVNPCSRPISMINSHGIVLKTFKDCTAAAKELNKHPSTISDHIRGKIKISKDGYTFRLCTT